MNQAQLAQVRELMRQHRFCVIATSTADGRPWVTPVFYNYDETTLAMVWESDRTAKHSQLIAANPLTAIVISDMKAVTGAYFECRAAEVAEERLEDALERFNHGVHKKRERKDRTRDDYTGAKPLRLYEARPYAAYLMSDKKLVDGYEVDDRVELDIFDA